MMDRTPSSGDSQKQRSRPPSPQVTQTRPPGSRRTWTRLRTLSRPLKRLPYVRVMDRRYARLAVILSTSMAVASTGTSIWLMVVVVLLSALWLAAVWRFHMVTEAAFKADKKRAKWSDAKRDAAWNAHLRGKQRAGTGPVIPAPGSSQGAEGDAFDPNAYRVGQPPGGELVRLHQNFAKSNPEYYEASMKDYLKDKSNRFRGKHQ